MEGGVEASEEGTPQGGPLSPLLANIYLDALDKELDQRGHSYCRYADDCNIYVGSQAAAERTLESVQNWIEKHLRLKVNADKSGTGRVWERKFLGFRLNRQRNRNSAGKRRAIQGEGAGVVAKLPEPDQQMSQSWQQLYRGWWGYFRLARSAARSSGWKAGFAGICGSSSGCGGMARRTRRKLRGLGVTGPLLKVAHSSKGRGMSRTALTKRPEQRGSATLGFLMPSDLAAT